MIYKLRCYEEDFKGTKSIVLENNKISVRVLPLIGGKISSMFLKEKNFELFYQNTKGDYKEAKLYSKFGDFDRSGFDDCFPSIDEGEHKGIHYPDHGETWARQFDYAIKENGLELSVKSQVLNYSFNKFITLEDNKLKVNYKIKNTGDSNIEGFYTVHGLTKCEDEMELVFPKGTKKVLNVAGVGEIGNEGDILDFPFAKREGKKDYDLRIVAPESAQKCEKFYVYGEYDQGLCGINYHKSNVVFMMTYDKMKLPYLGMWLNEGGFGAYNCAFEPSNGYYDSMKKAVSNNKYMILKPEKVFEFDLFFSLT